MIYLDREQFEARALELAITLYKHDLAKDANVEYEFQPVEGRMWKCRQMLFDAGFAWKVDKPTCCGLCGCDTLVQQKRGYVDGSTRFACGVTYEYASGGMYLQTISKDHNTKRGAE